MVCRELGLSTPAQCALDWSFRLLPDPELSPTTAPYRCSAVAMVSAAGERCSALRFTERLIRNTIPSGTTPCLSEPSEPVMGKYASAPPGVLGAVSHQ